jgi:hypothetical protein
MFTVEFTKEQQRGRGGGDSCRKIVDLIDFTRTITLELPKSGTV